MKGFLRSVLFSFVFERAGRVKMMFAYGRKDGGGIQHIVFKLMKRKRETCALAAQHLPINRDTRTCYLQYLSYFVNMSRQESKTLYLTQDLKYTYKMMDLVYIPLELINRKLLTVCFGLEVDEPLPP